MAFSILAVFKSLKFHLKWNSLLFLPQRGGNQYNQHIKMFSVTMEKYLRKEEMICLTNICKRKAISKEGIFLSYWVGDWEEQDAISV